MYHWNTKRIVEYIKTIDEIESVEVQMPGGDVDTEQVVCKVRGADDGDQYIFASGFSTDEAFMYIDYEEKGDIDVEFVEVTDQSGHGLQSNDFQVATAYIKVRQHFVGGGATVVDHLKDYF